MTTSTEAAKPASEDKTRKILGLVAGTGKLPVILAQSAQEKGYDVIAFGMTEEACELVKPHTAKTILIAAGQLGRNIKHMREQNVKEIVFVGKVPKLDYLMRQVHKLDWTAIKELSKLPNFNDDTVQRCVGDVCEAQGIRVLTQSEFLRHIFPEVGVITKRQPTGEEYADVEFGFRIAKEIARLDIGQTVIVKDKTVLAIEAAEGTDYAIKRAVQLAKGPVVVCKVAKPGQDQRFDIPTVGMNTLESMISQKPGGVLAVEAGETMVVEQSEMAALADSKGISIVAI